MQFTNLSYVIYPYIIEVMINFIKIRLDKNFIPLCLMKNYNLIKKDQNKY